MNNTASNRVIGRQVFTDPTSFSTTMLSIMLDTYGSEFIQWAPATILLETEQDFNFKWNTGQFDRLMAGVAVLTTDSFYNSLPDFIELCNILSGSPATPDSFDPADASECAWGITEAMLLAPPSSDAPFSEEICAYIGKVVDMEGIIVPPDVLKIGLSDEDKKVKVHNDYSDDPDMFTAIWEVESGKTDDINAFVFARLQALLQQLTALRLVNGSTEELVAKITANLSSRSG
jgi:hypothetical protein